MAFARVASAATTPTTVARSFQSPSDQPATAGRHPLASWFGFVADQGGGPGVGDAVDLVLDDRAADGGVLDREGAAEAAALVGLFHGAEVHVADLPQQFDAFVLDADAA